MSIHAIDVSGSPRAADGVRADVEAPPAVRILAADGSLAPVANGGDAVGVPSFADEEVIALYRAMRRLRRIDERMTALSEEGRIGFFAGGAGEEAFVVGCAFATRANDWIFPSVREFGAALWRGMPLARYVDACFGNHRDPAKGRQMPNQCGDKAARVATAGGSLGTHLTHAVGLAWAAKTRRDDVAVLAFFGEGGTSSSDFHNSLNFAGVFKTPTLFACRRRDDAAGPADRGVAYGIPTVRVDGEDLFAVVTVAREAVLRASSGAGATLIEADWSTGSPDPLDRVRRYLGRTAGFSAADDEAIDAEVARDLDDAIRRAEEAPKPTRDSLFDDVYGTLPWHLAEQRDERGLRR